MASADFKTGSLAYKSHDYKTALREWIPLAKSGHAMAQNNVGIMYRRGLGVRKNVNTAAAWYRRAADQNYAKAQFNLALLYKSNQGVKKDLSKAIYWFEESARNGYGRAQYSIAIRYEAGNGVEQDNITALKWLSLTITNSSGQLRKNALKARKRVAKKLTKKEIAEARQMVREHLTGS